MSTVKLITPYVDARRDAELAASFHATLSDMKASHGVRVLDARGLDAREIADRIFKRYKGKLVILCAARQLEVLRRSLPVHSYVFSTAAETRQLVERGELAPLVLNSYSTRTHSRDGKASYDVFKLWWLTRDVKPVRMSVARMLTVNYDVASAADIETAKPWHDDESVGDIIKTRGENYNAIMGADLRYPLLVYSRASLYGRLVDGNHRLVKAALTGRASLPVVLVTAAHLAKARIAVPIDQYSSQF